MRNYLSHEYARYLQGKDLPRKSFATNLDFYLYEAGFFDGDFETKR